MRTRTGLLLIAALVGMIALTALRISAPAPKPAPANDPEFAAYTHLYGMHGSESGTFTPWMRSIKDRGAITDLAGKRIPTRTLDRYPDCVFLSIPFDRTTNKGFEWTEVKGGGANISSMSEDIQLLACTKQVDELEAFLNNN